MVNEKSAVILIKIYFNTPLYKKNLILSSNLLQYVQIKWISQNLLQSVQGK